MLQLETWFENRVEKLGITNCVGADTIYRHFDQNVHRNVHANQVRCVRLECKMGLRRFSGGGVLVHGLNTSGTLGIGVIWAIRTYSPDPYTDRVRIGFFGWPEIGDAA